MDVICTEFGCVDLSGVSRREMFCRQFTRFAGRTPLKNHAELNRRNITVYNRRSSFFNLPRDGNTYLYGIIGVNTAVFCAWTLSKNDRRFFRFMQNNFTLSSYGVLQKFRLHTLVTAMFSHADTFHFAANMITLYFFGSQAMMALGTTSFLSLYFAGGLVASACHILWPYVIPRSWPARYSASKYSPGLGASGAISAIVAWTIMRFPTSMVYIYFMIPVPAALFGVMYIGKDVYDLYQGGSGVGNASHLGGALVGCLYCMKRFIR